MKGEESGSLGSLRELNRARVVSALRETGVASRADLARRTGLSRSTVSTIIADLFDDGLVVNHLGHVPATASQGAGRPPTLLTLTPSAGAAVGIDFGKRHLAVAVADLSHSILGETWREMEDDYPAAEGLDAAADLVRKLLRQARVARERVLGVGLGLPGPIHSVTGTVGSASILPGWVGVRASDEMRARLSLPVHVENDANLGALAELTWGAGRGCAHLVYLKVSNGIGAGLIVSGRLFRGAGGTAGEVGHTILDETGDICRCGNRGCLETYAAGPAIVELLRRSLGEDLTLETVLARATQGEAGCRRAIADAGRHVGTAAANLCNVFNPERIVVGGSIGTAGDVLLEPMREAVARYAIHTAAADVEIVPSELGDRAELLGAVVSVLHGTDPIATPIRAVEARAR
jgi:predicted NBD/HSP70 family sugar kinase/lambda repressor-like predicted transcriptional regulator